MDKFSCAPGVTSFAKVFKVRNIEYLLVLNYYDLGLPNLAHVASSNGILQNSSIYSPWVKTTPRVKNSENIENPFEFTIRLRDS